MAKFDNNIINPFANIEAEDNKKEQIYSFFNRNEEIIKRFKERKHQFIWGTRGSGKSTLLRFFEPYCQFKEYGGWDKYFAQTDAAVSIYCPIPRAIINIKDFVKSSSPSKDVIFNHYCNMLFAESIMINLKEQLIDVEKNENLFNEFYDFFASLFDQHDSLVKDVNKKANKLSSIARIEKLIESEKHHANSFCAQYGLKKEYQYYAGSLTNYHNFILPLIKQIRNIYNIPVPIFLCIDDAGFLIEAEQEDINSWIANRNKDDLVIKVASDPLEYKTFTTIDNDSIRRIHDYDDIFLDIPDENNTYQSTSSLIDIANRRIRYYYSSPILITDLLQNDNVNDELIKSAKASVEEKANANISIKDKTRYISRYTMQEFYKQLYNSKQGKNDKTKVYRTIAGIDDLMSLSDFNARTFLRLCNAIFTEKYPQSFCPLNDEKKSDYSLASISPEIQNSAIKKYSQQEMSYIAKYKPEYSPELIGMLEILIDSLGALYREKLLDFTDKEYGVTSFTTDFSQLSDKEKATLRIAVESGFLLKVSYGSKNSFLKINSYNLSRRLFPAFSLEPKPYAGRLVIAPSILKKAFYNVKDFVESYKTEKKQVKETNSQLTFYDEEVIIDEERQNDYSELY